MQPVAVSRDFPTYHSLKSNYNPSPYVRSTQVLCGDVTERIRRTAGGALHTDDCTPYQAYILAYTLERKWIFLKIVMGKRGQFPVFIELVADRRRHRGMRVDWKEGG